MRYRAVISYDGANYVGWQRQLNGMSVQEKTEIALTKIFGTPTSCTASGRTDSGVHAEGQVIHFDAVTSIPTDKIPYAVNTELPDDISMLQCEETSDDFNARFSAKRKTYRYSLYSAPHRIATLNRNHTHIISPLNVDDMKKAAEYIVGEHDFKCFEASGSVVKSTVRTVFSIDIAVTQLTAIKGGAFAPVKMDISVTGNGFLYNMVRIMVGTVLEIAAGRFAADSIPTIIEGRDRTLAGPTAPPQGLCLERVFYD